LNIYQIYANTFVIYKSIKIYDKKDTYNLLVTDKRYIVDISNIYSKSMLINIEDNKVINKKDDTSKINKLYSSNDKQYINDQNVLKKIKENEKEEKKKDKIKLVIPNKKIIHIDPDSIIKQGKNTNTCVIDNIGMIIKKDFDIKINKSDIYKSLGKLK